MTKKEQNIFDKILKSLEQITTKLNITNNGLANQNIIEVEDGKGSGKMIKFTDAIYNQMIYTDVQTLKKESSAFYDDYSQEMKPLVRELKSTLKDVNSTISDLDKRISELEKDKPKKFGTWLVEKATFANSGADILKLLVYVIIIFAILSTAMPQLSKFLKAIIAGSGN